MNESIEGNTTPVMPPPVTEGLSVQESPLGSEKNTKIIIFVVLVLLVLIGLARFFLVGDHEAEYVAEPTETRPATQATTPENPTSRPANNGATQF